MRDILSCGLQPAAGSGNAQPRHHACTGKASLSHADRQSFRRYHPELSTCSSRIDLHYAEVQSSLFFVCRLLAWLNLAPSKLGSLVLNRTAAETCSLHDLSNDQNAAEILRELLIDYEDVQL